MPYCPPARLPEFTPEPIDIEKFLKKFDELVPGYRKPMTPNEELKALVDKWRKELKEKQEQRTALDNQIVALTLGIDAVTESMKTEN